MSALLSPLVAGLVQSRMDSVLQAIGQRGVRLAIWHRQLEPELARAVEAGLQAGANFRIEGGVEDVLVEIAGVLADPELGPLRDDIGRLARGLAGIAPTNVVRARLETLDGDGCSLFHADVVSIRLLCTYAGPGTEWRCSLEAAMTHRIPTGAVAVLRGLGGPDREDGACLHRSPPIAGTGAQRLLLAIEPLDRNRADRPG